MQRTNLTPTRASPSILSCGSRPQDRRWFHAAPSATDHQRTCGAECRRARRRWLARRRRRPAVQDFRVDERNRQRERRKRVAVAATAGHAPASAPKPAEFAEKMLESWDEAVAVSRASLQRRFAVILRQSVVSAETARRTDEARSRATLGP